MLYYIDNIFTSENIDNYIGFVYCITNLETNRKYIGKKTFYFSRTKLINGRRKKVKIPSDWESYYGSNKILQAEVITNGINNYKREILHLCKTKSEASYLELKEQMNNNVLETDDYYNEYIMVKINKKHIASLFRE